MIQHADDLKYQIERILHWEPSSHWRLRDFVSLSELVQTRTQQPLEARDLQAFWQSSVMPSPTVLNTLASFADYTDWDDFCRRNAYGTVETDDEAALFHAPMWEIPVRWVVLICWLSVLAAVAVGILLVWKQ